MSKCEALIELNPEKVESLSEYIAYCKYYFKPKSEEKIKNYLYENKHTNKWYLNRKNKNKLLMEFKFLEREREINSCISSGKRKSECEEELAKKLKDYKSNDTLKDFPLNWLKNEIINEKEEILDENNENKNVKEVIRFISFENDINIQKVKQISGVYQEGEFHKLQNYINKLPQYSFAIWFKFTLDSPYFSKDDDEFYIIQNPIIKEANFKVPMIRGSSWKGALAHVFRELFKEDIHNNGSKVESFLRIFGASSESLKEVEDYLYEKVKNLEKLKEKLIDFLLFELGVEIDGNTIRGINNINSRSDLIKFLKKILVQKLEENQKDIPIELQTHKGRAIFYPTYFNKLSLEIINPHDRRKRAGTNPIHYEVVPKGTEGIFQLIYIPFDGILKSDEKLKKEVEKDLENLIEAIKILQEKGVGAKTKLGWGRFEIEENKKFVCVNGKLDIPRGWRGCQN